jgi:hypothetical protein
MTSRTLSNCHVDLALASYWPQICHIYHTPFCLPLVQTTRGPDTHALRVIDLKRECITAAPPRCKYAALSYTWGTTKQYKLMKATRETMYRPGWLKEGINQLPRTIVDAIHVCRGLSFRYLWVDALCIIQDCPGDKGIQISSMAFVYGGASLTIVAGFGDGADAGLPGISSPPMIRRFQSKIGNIDASTARISGLDSLLRSKWYTRGWTFQELVLSKRILAFTEEQMLFFCVRAFFQEDMVLEPVNGMLRQTQNQKGLFDRHISVSGHNLRAVGDVDESHSSIHGNSASDIFQSSFRTNEALESYWRFLTSYLRRDLSYEGDFLNAFAGILDALSPYLGVFRWGIAVLHPAQMLTWHFLLAFPLQRRPGFPSWSWAGWIGYKGDLQFHELSVSYYDGPSEHATLFYSCLENRRIIRFELLQLRNFQDHSQEWDFTDREWAQVRTDPGQYLLLLTRTVFLAVDAEPCQNADSTAPPHVHPYSVRLPLTQLRIGQVYLKSSWRSKQPAELEFISIAEVYGGESLMLIQRCGPVAFRIQMVNQPTGWARAVPSTRQAIILG